MQFAALLYLPIPVTSRARYDTESLGLPSPSPSKFEILYIVFPTLYGDVLLCIYLTPYDLQIQRNIDRVSNVLLITFEHYPPTLTMSMVCSLVPHPDDCILHT